MLKSPLLRGNTTALSLSPLLATVIAAATETPASPQDETYHLPTVYVSASRLPADGGGTRNTVVLDSEEISRRAPESISDLLAGLPGVDARARGPFGVQADLEVNGATFSQVLVLVDGMRVNDPQTGHHTLNLPLAPRDLERVEITYGPGSAIHGPDAFGAVVNLVPKSDPTRRLDLGGHWGRALGAQPVAGVGSDASLSYGVKGNWGSVWATGGKSRADGYRADTDFDTDRALVSARLPAAGGDVSLLWGVQDKAFGANDFYGPYPSEEWTRAWLYSARFRRAGPAQRGLEGHVYYRRHRDRFVLVRDNPALYENNHTNSLAAAHVHGSAAAGSWGALLAGAEVASETIDSNNLGDRERRRGALFSEFHGGRGRCRVDAGARLDRHEGFGWRASPSLAMSFRHTSRARYFATVGRSYRVPSFTESFYEDPNNVGNPDLGAESAWSLEGGAQITPTGALNVTASSFVRYEDNLVDYIRSVDSSPWAARNLGEMRTAGLQLTAVGTWPSLLTRLDYTFVDKEQTLTSGLQSKYVFTHPRHQLGLQLDHPLVAGFRAGWQLTLKERQAQEDYEPARAIRLLDLVVQRRFGYGRSLLRLRNLTDHRYESVLGVPMPGRWFSVETQIDL